MRNYKIVFVDIDDTLNPTNEYVSEKNKQVLSKLKEKGIITVVCTGRCINYSVNKSKEALMSNYVIGSNGTEVYDYENNKIIFERTIPKDIVKSVYEYCCKTNITLLFNSMNNRFINNKEYTYNDEKVIYFDNIDKLLSENDINQMCMLSDNYDRMLLIPNMFKEKYPSLNIVHSSKELVNGIREHGKEYYHDIVMENTSKSTGVVELLDYLGIDSNDAISIGNGYDDICVFDVVGTSVAVDNSNDSVKSMATYVTKSCNEDGVAFILEKLCL